MSAAPHGRDEDLPAEGEHAEGGDKDAGRAPRSSRAPKGLTTSSLIIRRASPEARGKGARLK